MRQFYAETLQGDIREALSGFAVKYFSGQSFSFGGVPVYFPLVDVQFEEPQFGPPFAIPRLVIQFSNTEKERERKVRDEGLFVRADLPCALTVFTTDMPAGLLPTSQNYETNDQIQNLVGLLFSGQSNEIAELGLRPMRMDDLPLKVSLPSLEYQISRRMVTFEIEMFYRRLTP